MRSQILTALSVMTLSSVMACGGEPPPPPAPPPPPPPVATASAPAPADTTPPPPPKPALADVMPQTLKGIGEAFNAHDAQKMAGYFTDDAAVYAYGEPAQGETHSRGDLTTGMTGLFTAFPDAKSAALRVWVKGNIAISEVVWTGTMQGDMGPMKATNKPVGEQRLNVMIFNDDGLVKEMHEYGDGATIVAQALGKKNAPAVPTLPTNPPEVHTGKGTPDEDKLVDWAKAEDDTFSKDDAKGVLATMADDADYWINVGGGPATKGKKDNQKALTAWFKAFPDQKWTTNSAWGIDGFAIVEHTVSGTHKGAMGPLPASGKPVQSWHWVDILQPTADGKVQHGWGYANMFEMLTQTGQLQKMMGDSGKAAGHAAKAAAPKKP